jgi:hypothetical protein
MGLIIGCGARDWQEMPICDIVDHPDPGCGRCAECPRVVSEQLGIAAD